MPLTKPRVLPPCLYSLLAQTRPPDEIIVVNNASTDATRALASAVSGICVVDEPTKGLVVARERGRQTARGEILAYLDADCRAPLQWLEQMERRFDRYPALVGVTGPYRFYDWDSSGRTLLRAYDYVVAPPTSINDREELHTLEERMKLIQRLVEHTLVELEPTELAVKIERGIEDREWNG